MGADPTLISSQTSPRQGKYGAGNQDRTGDLNLGKVALYQLSYARLKGLDDGPKSGPGRE